MPRKKTAASTSTKAAAGKGGGTMSAAKYLSTLLAGGMIGQYAPQVLPGAEPAAPAAGKAARIEVRFSPKGGCADLAVRTIATARKQILVHAYGFNSPTIAQALIAAHQRGVKVEMLIDKPQNISRTRQPLGRSQVGVARTAGIPLWVERKVAIGHNKVMIIDNKAVITGSYNWTTNAEEKNAENLVVLHDKATVKRYLDNWKVRKAVAKPINEFMD